jgi:hypothetical protein
MKSKRIPPPVEELLFSTALSASEARNLQRQADAGAFIRVYKGIYAPRVSDEEMSILVRRNWQRVTGVVVPGGVVSHISAFKGGLLLSGEVTLSHPTVFNKKG